MARNVPKRKNSKKAVAPAIPSKKIASTTIAPTVSAPTVSAPTVRSYILPPLNLQDREQFAEQSEELLATFRYQECEILLGLALERFPDDPHLLFNRARLDGHYMRVEKAILAYRKVLALNPASNEARHCIADLLFINGEYAEGFLHFRMWLAYPELIKRNPWSTFYPIWDGQDLNHKKLMVWMGFGDLGDMLELARFLPLIKQRWAEVTISVMVQPPCLRLLNHLVFAKPEQMAEGFPKPVWDTMDYIIPMFHLPSTLGIDIDSIPYTRGYFVIPKPEIDLWRQRLSTLPGLKIGLCWASGFAKGTERSYRSLYLRQLLPLLQTPGLSFVVLQKGDDARADLEELPSDIRQKIYDAGAENQDFFDDAGAIMNLDLVVSVDTSVAHLAGSLGKPLFVLQVWGSTHPWLKEGLRAPWYDSARVLRQVMPKDWGKVVQDLVLEVRKIQAGDTTMFSDMWSGNDVTQHSPKLPTPDIPLALSGVSQHTPEDGGAHRLIPSVAEYMAKARAAEQANDTAGAVAIWQAGLRDHPEDANAWMCLAVALGNQGLRDHAEKIWVAVLARYPARFTLWYYRALVLHKQNRLAEALRSARFAIALSPANEEAGTLLAEIQALVGYSKN